MLKKSVKMLKKTHFLFLQNTKRKNPYPIGGNFEQLMLVQFGAECSKNAKNLKIVAQTIFYPIYISTETPNYNNV